MLCAKRSFGAIEMALWDIRGKLEGRPLSTLLGGAVRTEIPLTEYFPTAFPAPTMRVSQRRWRSRVSARGCSRSSAPRAKPRDVAPTSRLVREALRSSGATPDCHLGLSARRGALKPSSSL